jgi:thiol:disulfide interchange protein
MGLHFLGVFRFAFINREKRYQQEARPAGLLGAYAVGLAFAFGWTPCIGPVLATILAVAASEDSVARGAFLLAVYSVGLGVPFLLAALAVGKFLTFLRRFAKHLDIVEKAMGVLLILAGIAFLTGLHQNFRLLAARDFPDLFQDRLIIVASEKRVIRCASSRSMIALLRPWARSSRMLNSASGGKPSASVSSRMSEVTLLRTMALSARPPATAARRPVMLRLMTAVR